MTETHTMDTFSVGFQDGDFDLHVGAGLRRPADAGNRVQDLRLRHRRAHAARPGGRTLLPHALPAQGLLEQAGGEREALRDGWLHTGDIGKIDAEGFIHFLGRRKEMLKVRGMSVFPAEIEALLGQHPAVLGLGRDRPRGPGARARFRWPSCSSGRRPLPAPRGRTQAWCRERMAGYKLPEIRLVDSLANGATGKVLKNELVKLLA